jgi:uncharacterized protein (TIGR02145 family)
MHLKKYVYLILLFPIIFNSCAKHMKDSFEEEDYISNYNILKETITDVDGNRYTSVLIGNKWVMVDFLRVTHFRNGDPIPTFLPNRHIFQCDDVKPIYQWPLDYDENDSIHGRFYSWYTLNDERGVCPDGYHVPSRDEIDSIRSYITWWKLSSGINWNVHSDDYSCFQEQVMWLSDSLRTFGDPYTHLSGCNSCVASIKCVRDENKLHVHAQIDPELVQTRIEKVILPANNQVLKHSPQKINSLAANSIINTIPGLQLCGPVVLSILPYNDEIWIGTTKGLTQYKPSVPHSACLNDKFEFDHDSRVLCGAMVSTRNYNFCANNGIFVYDNVFGDFWDEPDYDFVANIGVYSAYTDSNMDIWYGTRKGVYKQTGDKINYVGLDNKSIYGIQIDESNNKWFGTNKGLNKNFDIEYTRDNGLICDEVLCLALVPGNQLWIGTPLGLSMFDGQNWTSISTFNSQGCTLANVMVTDHNGNLWVGTYGGGVSVFDGVSWNTYTEEDGLINNYVTALAVDDENQIWVGTVKGISLIK